MENSKNNLVRKVVKALNQSLKGKILQKLNLNEYERGIYYFYFGKCLGPVGRHDDAIKYLNESVNICEKFGDLYHKAIGLIELAIFYEELGKYDLMEKKLKESLEILKDLHCSIDIAYVKIKLADMCLWRSDAKSALELFQEALDIFEQINRLNGIAESLIGLCSSYRLNYEFEKALKFIKKAISIFKSIPGAENYHGFMYALFHKALAYLEMEKYDDAIKLFRKVVMRSKYRHLREYAMGFMGIAYLMKGHFDKGKEILKQALKESKIIGDYDDISEI